jgi:hypothetical protein
MKPAENVEKHVKKIQIKTNPQVNKAVFNDLLERMDIAAEAPMGTRRQNIGRIIMKSKITKFAAAAMIVVVGLIYGPWPGSDVGGKLYAMSNVTDLLQKAETLHIEGVFFLPKENASSNDWIQLPFEYWFDINRGWMRLHKPGGLKDPNSPEPKYYDTVLDGKYQMQTFYEQSLRGESIPVVRFTKFTPFQCRLEVRRAGMGSIMGMLGSINQMNNITKIGQEEINGTVFDVWEGEYFRKDRGTKIKTWLNPGSGEVGRAFCWGKQNGDAKWIPHFELHKVERNIEFPVELFTTVAPQGVKLDNTKETAPSALLGELGEGGRSYVGIHVGFTLDDGSIIAGWSVGNVDAAAGSCNPGSAAGSCDRWNLPSQIDKFRDLQVGGKLPDLPAKIVGFKMIPNTQEIVYKGYHLAVTQKQNTFCEWSIYIPDRDVLPRKSFYGYEVLTEYNNNKDLFRNRDIELSDDLVIEGREDFERWVLGAIGDMSDTGAAPAHVTYNNVMQLSKKLRQPLEDK